MHKSLTELNSTHVRIILQGRPLAAELNPTHDRIILQGSLLAAELNTAHDRMIFLWDSPPAGQ